MRHKLKEHPCSQKTTRPTWHLDACWKRHLQGNPSIKTPQRSSHKDIEIEVHTWVNATVVCMCWATPSQFGISEEFQGFRDSVWFLPSCNVLLQNWRCGREANRVKLRVATDVAECRQRTAARPVSYELIDRKAAPHWLQAYFVNVGSRCIPVIRMRLATRKWQRTIPSNWNQFTMVLEMVNHGLLVRKIRKVLLSSRKMLNEMALNGSPILLMDGLH